MNGTALIFGWSHFGIFFLTDQNHHFLGFPKTSAILFRHFTPWCKLTLLQLILHMIDTTHGLKMGGGCDLFIFAPGFLHHSFTLEKGVAHKISSGAELRLARCQAQRKRTSKTGTQTDKQLTWIPDPRFPATTARFGMHLTPTNTERWMKVCNKILTHVETQNASWIFL